MNLLDRVINVAYGAVCAQQVRAIDEHHLDAVSARLFDYLHILFGPETPSALRRGGGPPPVL